MGVGARVRVRVRVRQLAHGVRAVGLDLADRVVAQVELIQAGQAPGVRVGVGVGARGWG